MRLSQAAGDRWLEGMCWREAGLAARALGEYGRAEAALLRALDLIDAPEQVERACASARQPLHPVPVRGGLPPGAGRRAAGPGAVRAGATRCSSAGCPWATSARRPRRWATRSWRGAALRRAWPLPGRSRTAPRRSCAWGIWAGWRCRRARPDAAREHLAAALALAEEIDSRARTELAARGVGRGAQPGRRSDPGPRPRAARDGPRRGDRLRPRSRAVRGNAGRSCDRRPRRVESL